MTHRTVVEFPITTCRLCGERDWRHVAVLGAVGSYCRGCAVIVMFNAETHRLKAFAKMKESGVFVIPVPLYDPKGAT